MYWSLLMLPPCIPTIFDASMTIPTNSVKGISNFRINCADRKLLKPTFTRPMILLSAWFIIFTRCSGALVNSAFIPIILPAMFSSIKICLDNFWLTEYNLKFFWISTAASVYCLNICLLTRSYSFLARSSFLESSFRLPMFTLYLKSSWKNLSTIFYNTKFMMCLCFSSLTYFFRNI